MALPERDPAEKAIYRQRRGRNWALAAALVLLVVLFYLITIVRMGGS